MPQWNVILLSVAGGLLELGAIVTAAASAVHGYRKSIDRYDGDAMALAVDIALEDDPAPRSREQHVNEHAPTLGDLSMFPVIILKEIASNARKGAIWAAILLSLGVILSTAANVVGATGT